MMSSTEKAGLTSLPYQFLIDKIIPLLDTESLLQLKKVSKPFKEAVNDELHWIRRMTDETKILYPSAKRMAIWKKFYRDSNTMEPHFWGNLRESPMGLDIQLNRDGCGHHSSDIKPKILSLLIFLKCAPLPVPFQLKVLNFFDASAKVVEGTRRDHEVPPDLPPRDQARIWRNALEDEDEDGNADRNLRQYPKKLIKATGLVPNHPDTEIGIPIQLHSGSNSCYVLTHLGHIVAWGYLGNHPDISGAEKHLKRPTLLDLNGQRAKVLTVSNCHAVAQMEDGTIFEWTKRWDRPAIHSPSTLLEDVQTSKNHIQIRQIEAGPDFTAILLECSNLETGKNEIKVVLWETAFVSEDLKRKWFDAATSLEAENKSLNHTWPVDFTAVTLPKPPRRLVKIAAGHSFIIGLTKKGAVYRLYIPSSGRDLTEPYEAHVEKFRSTLIENYAKWTLLPQFCTNIGEAGDRGTDGNIWDRPEFKHLLNSRTRMTHISAHNHRFAVYSPEAGKGVKSEHVNEETGKGLGIVLLGETGRTIQGTGIRTTTIKPELQGIGVIKVVYGDKHSGVLTMNGNVLSWGKQSTHENFRGTLGTWDSITIPEVSHSILEKPIQSINLRKSQIRFPTSNNHMHHYHTHGEYLLQTQDYSGEKKIVSKEEVEEEEEKMIIAEKQRFKLRILPERNDTPQIIRFGFPKLGEVRNGKKVEEDDDQETKFAFDISFGMEHSISLTIDKNKIDEVKEV